MSQKKFKVGDVVKTRKPVRVGTRHVEVDEDKLPKDMDKRTKNHVRKGKKFVVPEPIMADPGQRAIVREIVEEQTATNGKVRHAVAIVELLDSPHKGTRPVPLSDLALGSISFEA